MKKRIFIQFTILLVWLCTAEVHAQVMLAGWNTYNQSGWGVQGLLPTSQAPNLTYAGLTKGAGLTGSGSAAGHAWGANGWSANPATAISSQDFVTFAITPDAGYELSLASISPFVMRVSSTGPIKCLIQYQVGSGSFTDIYTHSISRPGSTSNFSMPLISLSAISDLQHVPPGTTVTFRIIPYENTGSTGTWYIGDNSTSTVHMAVNGTVSAAVPACAVTAGTISSTAGMLCGTDSAVLSLTGAAPAAGVHYQWKASPDGISWNNTGGDTDTLATGSISATTYYKCIISCIADSSVDSTPVFTLPVHQPSASVAQLTICSNQLPYIWNGISVSAGGPAAAIYTTQNAAGCDSVVTLDLTVNPAGASTESLTICDNQLPYTWHGITVNAAGTAVATATLSDSTGCDSVVTLNLTVNPAAATTERITVCSDQLPYTWNGITITQWGPAAAVYRTVNAVSCDSIVTLDLYVDQVVIPEVHITATPGTDIAAGRPVTFAAWVSNGGLSPAVVWRKNGQVVSSGSISFTDNNPADQDVITCAIYSDIPCARPDSAVSNTLVMHVTGGTTDIDHITANASGLLLYPNPHNGIFTIAGAVAPGDVSVGITSLAGQMVYNETIAVADGRLQHQVRLGASVAAGTYIARITTAGKTEVLRFSIVR